MVSPFKKIDSDFISIMDGDDEGMSLKLSAGQKSHTPLYLKTLVLTTLF